MEHSSRREARHRLEGPPDSLIYATLQELATRVAHCNTAAIAGDTVVERLLARITADENLHYAFYRDVVAAALDLAPSAVVPAIRRQVLAFAMPALELRNLRERAASIAAAGIYSLQIHQEQVLCPLLLDHWRLRELRGLDAVAMGARDEVLGFLAGLRGSGDETEQGPPLP